MSTITRFAFIFALMALATAGIAGTPYNASPFNVGDTIPAAEFDRGGDGVAFHNPATGQSNPYRAEAVAIGVCPDTDGGTCIINTVPDEWFNYAVNVATTGTYDLQVRIGNPEAGRYAHMEIDGTNATGRTNLVSNGTSGWTVYNTHTFAGYRLTAGQHVLKFYLETPVGLVNIHWLKIVPHVTMTYYVSPTGDDNNNGTSSSTPWKTCAKANAFHFNPGDTVLFQRGGEWRESVNPVGGDGTADNPITFADYGTGAKPRFWGSDVLDNAGFTHLTGNVYSYTTSAQVNSVLVDHKFLVWANANAGQSVDQIANSWWWSGNTLKINVPTNPNTDGKVYTACRRQDIICNGYAPTYNFHNHLVFRNLVAEESAWMDQGYGVRIQNGTDMLLDGVEAYHNGKHSFGCINSTQVIHNNCRAGYPMPAQSGGYTAYVSYGDTSTGLANQTSEYHGCIGDHMEDTVVGQYVNTGYEFFTTHGAAIGSVWLDNCQSLSSSAGGPGAHWTIGNGDSQSAGHPAQIKITGGLIQNNQLSMYGTGFLVDGLRMTGPGATSTNDATATINMGCSNSTVQNCLLTGLNVGYWLYQAGIYDNGTNNTIRFNTIVNDSHSGNKAILNQADPQLPYGNIIVSSGQPAIGQYNLIYSSAASAGFANQGTGDYSLTSASPAKDYVPTSVSHPSTDIGGGIRPSGAACDAGAYEYGSAGLPIITSPTTATGQVGMAFSYQVVATNSPTIFAANGLPSGLTMSSGTGLIYGTPTTAETFPTTISASNSVGTGEATLTITINPTPESPYGSTRWSVPGLVEAENYDIGGEGVAYHDSTQGNAGGKYRIDDVDVSVCVDSSGGYQVGSTADGEWLKYMINTPTAGSYAFSARVASGSFAAQSTHIEIDGTDVTGSMAVPNSGSFSTFSTITSRSVRLTAGQHFMRVYFDAGGFVLNWVSVDPGGPTAPIITSAATATGQVGVAFSYQITGTDSPNSFDASSLPVGLTVDTGTGVISGTPTTAGTTNATVSATNSQGTGSAGLAVTINPATPVVTSSGTATATQGVAFSYQVTATNSPTSYSASGLPSGITVNTSTGAISGTPTVSGSFSVTIGATNAGGTGTRTLTLTVNPAGPVITSALTAIGNMSTAFSYQITGTNSPSSYGASGLPGGLTVDTTTGVISGTPTASGTTSATISATNAGGTGSATLVITTYPAGVFLTGAVGTPPSSVNLTTEGTDDWAHWGSEGSGNLDHKMISGSLVNHIANWGCTTTAFTYPGNAISYIWIDGNGWNGQAQASGMYFSEQNRYFTFTAPADNARARTLKVYCGTNAATGHLVAHLSDGSAPDYVSPDLAANSNAVYTLTYKAGSAGQTINIKWYNNSANGSITMQSATLQ